MNCARWGSEDRGVDAHRRWEPLFASGTHTMQLWLHHETIRPGATQHRNMAVHACLYPSAQLAGRHEMTGYLGYRANCVSPLGRVGPAVLLDMVPSVLTGPPLGSRTPRPSEIRASRCKSPGRAPLRSSHGSEPCEFRACTRICLRRARPLTRTKTASWPRWSY